MTEQKDVIARAAQIALGQAQAPADDTGWEIVAGHKDLNARGNGPWWYRMVWRKNQWQYFSDARLPLGTYRAHERRASVSGIVFPGELVCQHGKGGSVDTVYLVTDSEDTLTECAFAKQRDGNLRITLPGGAGELVVPNPRK